MSDIELLREAARLIRERAEAVFPPGLDWRALVMAHSGTALEHALHWSPAVALAVADWLESEATVHAELLAAAVAVQVTTSGRWRLRLDGSTLPQAIAVARAYLGRPE